MSPPDQQPMVHHASTPDTSIPQTINCADHFVCLNPRKKKHKIVDALLSPLGTIRWIAFPLISFRNWPETTIRAEQALSAATKLPKTSVTRSMKRVLLALQYNWSRKLFSERPDVIAVCWNGLNGTRRVFMDGARDAGVRRLFFELGPLPGRITVDPCGVNYANSLPRDITPYRAWRGAAAYQPDSWRAAGRGITQRSPKRPPAERESSKLPLTDPFLFAPLQVPGDSQLRLFGGNFRTVDAFVDALCEAASHLPTGWHLRVKEHPSAASSVANHLSGLSDSRVVVDNVTDTFRQVAASQGVVTVNSSVGLEAMFFDKPVIAAGRCFWAIDGVAVGAPTVEELCTYFANPSTIMYDDDSRDAFLGYLTEEYYPSVSGTSAGGHAAELIGKRLHGEDEYGFWSCRHVTQPRELPE